MKRPSILTPLGIFLFLFGTSGASAQFWQKHSNWEECLQVELRQYSAPTEPAFLAARAYCDKIYTEKEIKKIETKCGFRARDAIKEGYALYEIRKHLEQSNPQCLK